MGLPRIIYEPTADNYEPTENGFHEPRADDYEPPDDSVDWTIGGDDEEMEYDHEQIEYSFAATDDSFDATAYDLFGAVPDDDKWEYYKNQLYDAQRKIKTLESFEVGGQTVAEILRVRRKLVACEERVEKLLDKIGRLEGDIAALRHPYFTNAVRKGAEFLSDGVFAQADVKARLVELTTILERPVHTDADG